ncbi:MAG: HAMP domain-containing histidine kinase [bacterium]|nr:HAMP domain-containing histidine kinase [bacterium]
MTGTANQRPRRTPRFAKTLLFRLSAIFLAFLGLCLGGYFLWIQATVFSPYADDAEKKWFETRADSELDALAATLASVDPGSAAAGSAIANYGEKVTRFGVELMVFGPRGTSLAGTPGDSLMAAVPAVEVSLLSQMATSDWDFSRYPDKSNVDAFENRIFDVNVIGEPGSPRGYLVASYRPLEIDAGELEAHSNLLVTQQRLVKVLAGMLVLAAVGALLLMGWTSRRISRLSVAMEAFTGGDLRRRVGEGGSDEIDDLGRHFNHMARHIESMLDSLRQKEQFQRQLIANVSHDLRTPMASLRGHVESLNLRFDQLDAAQRARALDTISGNLEHLDRLVERMLVLSRLDAGQAAIQPEDFSIVELADSVMRRCEHLALPTGITIEMRAEPRLPLVHADPLQVALVLQNLLENGIKFNRPAGRVTLTLARVDAGARVLLSVADTGRGIAEADIPHIFERFYTGDASRTRKGGAPAHLQYSSGLGLAIAAKVVAAHGDELQVTSRPGEGAEFRFHLAAAVDQGLASMSAEG